MTQRPLTGTLAARGNEILSVLQGDFLSAKKLLLPALLLAWLYRGSAWARWILMALLRGFRQSLRRQSPR